MYADTEITQHFKQICTPVSHKQLQRNCWNELCNINRCMQYKWL